MDGKMYIEDAFEKLKNLHQSEKTEIWLVMDGQNYRLYILKIIARQGLPYQQLVKLKHPGLPEIRYVFEHENHTYVVEEYLQGQTLAQYIGENEFLSEEKVENILKQLCQCLMFLHAHKIIHRDIKPSNLFLTDDGRLKLIDFDAARIKKDNQLNDTVCLGTKGFAAPEQYGSQATDERSDIYALGVTMQALLGANYCGRLTNIIDMCTEYDAKRRFQNIESLEAALQNKVIVEQKSFWKLSLHYQIYHLPFFIIGLGLFFGVISMGYSENWHKYEEITWHIETASLALFVYLCFRQRIFQRQKEKIKNFVLVAKMVNQLKRILLLVWYYCIWTIALFILISALGISYSRPWEKIACEMVFILPFFLSYGSFQWYLVKANLRN
jgi:Serine/threonine protein kinase